MISRLSVVCMMVCMTIWSTATLMCQEFHSSRLEPVPASIVHSTVFHDTSYQIGRFSMITGIEDSVAVVRKSDKFGLITKMGWWIVPPDKVISFFSNGITHGRIGKLEVRSGGYEMHTSLCNGGFAGSYIICDSLGTILVPSLLTYTNTLPLNDSNYIYYVTYDERNSSPSCKNCGECYGTIGVMDYFGRIIVPTGNYTFITSFKEGIATVENNNYKWGFIDTSGANVIPCIYDAAGICSEGLATVVQNRKIGYVNTKGELVIPLLFDDAHPFKDGKALVIQGQSKFYINTKGERI